MKLENTNPLLLSIPDSFESNRLTIRAPIQGDGFRVNEAVKESIEELRPWMPWAQQIPTIEESEIVTRQGRIRYMEGSDLMLYLIEKKTSQIIGGSGLHRIDWQARKFEIGYWVRTSYRGQGFITEAVERITQFVIHELQANRIEIRCDSRNERSARVAERLGFTKEGMLRHEKCDVNGFLRDTLIFAKVRGVEF
ncbi:ribosomal-protein-serine acetyltransferase [Paenibacillus baekrokdamisoli]|uniref:Ribosomal-protein-serine acetyltransferase n=1 Tax=Paenibacillus baekrokdamisoli TaxID=1712516 RepID=A0A3G9IN84_9BACL|nr:GNAT family protein [Paenibacillus baekrokdamisoli]MBB3072007.1 RimJ/RimL family protein N-acetyltransferase [Paenibacillus baekrokdamisoli]BBH20310.1 ribosomal-protein-serine acetyltransferase [Paenibacillus baekrokdamisoli]